MQTLTADRVARVPGAPRGAGRRGQAPGLGCCAPVRRPAPQRRSTALERVAAAAYSTAAGAASTPPAAPPPAAAAPPAAARASTTASKTSTWPCKGGGLVVVEQQQRDGTYQLRIRLDPGTQSARVPPGSTVELHWGLYRSSPHLWQHPPEVVPPGSTRDERSGAMCSGMAAAAGSYAIDLAVPAAMAPLTLAFVLRVTPPAGATDVGGRPLRRHFVTPVRGHHFSALLGTSPGSSERQGVSLLPGSGGAAGATLNFAVRCRGADRVCLVLMRPKPLGYGDNEEWGQLELVLDPVANRTGDLWHVAVEGLTQLENLCYGWRLEGDLGWESGARVQPYQLLLDPYCPSLRYFPAEAAAKASPLPLPTIFLPDGSSRAVLSSLEGLAAAAAATPAAVAAAEAAYVPGPGHSLEELRLLELDVRTFAQGKGVTHPGGFLGVAERVSHIRAVGANAVLLTPSYAAAKGIGLMARAAVHHLAADPLLASTGWASSAAAARDFRAMVSALHAAGIEVLLMVDLAFTAEGTDGAPHTLSLRGLDHAAYYRANDVLNCGHAATRAYVLAALHHWADEGVDGFCFINAENMVQDRDGVVLDAPPLADALCHDPRLAALKLVALASDDSLLPRGGARGFPHWALWQQRNTGFGADVLAYLAEGTTGLLTAVAGRLTGSAAVFDADWGAGYPGNLAAGRRPAFGINSVTVLGRQSLTMLAAEAAEAAAAAAAAEAAGGYGGARAPPPTAATVAKSLLALAVLSLGVPIVPQDAVADLPTAHFVGVLMRLRRRLAPLLLPPRFDSPRDIHWHAADAAVGPVWDGDAAAAAAAAGARNVNFLAFSGACPPVSPPPPCPPAGCRVPPGLQRVVGLLACTATAARPPPPAVRGAEGQAVYVGVNPHPHPVTARLPPPAPGRVWERIVDTSRAPAEDALLEGGEPVSGGMYQVAPKAVVLLQAAVVESPGLQQQQLGYGQPQAPNAAQPPYAAGRQQQPGTASPSTQLPQLSPKQQQLRRLLLTQQQQEDGQPRAPPAQQ